jgi:hypothetical protein
MSRTVFSALSSMRLLACPIVAPRQGYDERRHHSAEEKIRIVLEGLCGEVSIAELCRKQAAFAGAVGQSALAF